MDHAEAVGTETVLVVEDEDAVRLLTRRILEEANYRVFDAPNPQQAEAAIRPKPNCSAARHRCHHAWIDGASVVRAARSTQPNLKVLYVSGYTDTAIIKDGQMDPTVELLQKPFSANALKRRIREVLDGN